MNIALIFAGGVGSRMGASLPKQFLKINGKPILVHTVELFQCHEDIDVIYIATIEDYIPYVEKLVKLYDLNKVADVIGGGDSAQDTIYRLLQRAKKDYAGDSIVLLHDGVRPFVDMEVITRNIEGVKANGNAITSCPAYETIMVSEDHDAISSVTIRDNTFLGQAPQSFRLDDIIEAHDKIRQRPEGYKDMVDACTIIRTLGGTCHLVEGNRGNLKITTPEDVYTFKAFLQYREDRETFGLSSQAPRF